MEARFWINKWEQNEIGFHQSDYNDLLMRHFPSLGLQPGDHVLVPLCGKTRDIEWLLKQGFKVIGAELSEIAVQDLFKDLEFSPTIEKIGKLTKYSSDDLVVFAGDLFDLTADLLGPVNGIYDRAAMVALPEQMRVAYCKHLVQITQKAPQLLLTFIYDQSLKNGPPFSIVAEEVKAHYDEVYNLDCPEKRPVEGGLKGTIPADEAAWVLR